MTLEIHKADDDSRDVRIEINEVFPSHYQEPDRAAICESEAEALYDALKQALPDETKAALMRLLQFRGPLA